MPKFIPPEPLVMVSRLAKWLMIGTVVGVMAGAGSAAFLAGLYWATDTREANPWLLWWLPAGGLLIGWGYHRFGRDVEGGNNLLLERIHQPGGAVPWRMAPMIAIATVGTHLFGGSAGREGTAVQMGGGLADGIARLLRLGPADHRLVLISGISGGFGAVFGTPLAGTIFGLEVLSVGRIRYDALIPCLTAATVGDLVCRGLGIEHHEYVVGAVPDVTAGWLMWVLLAAIAFGLTGRVFAELTHLISRQVAGYVAVPWLRPFYGGMAVIGLTYLAGTRDYLGLSLPLIDRAFTTSDLFVGAFAWKTLFTSVTLGTGFKGGEVTPLFCIGATLGHAFATLTGQPLATFAALGFVAVFAAAAKTPLACVLMGIELFGAELAVPLMLACAIGFIISGRRGIYASQRPDMPDTADMPDTPDSPNAPDADSAARISGNPCSTGRAGVR